MQITIDRKDYKTDKEAGQALAGALNNQWVDEIYLKAGEYDLNDMKVRIRSQKGKLVVGELHIDSSGKDLYRTHLCSSKKAVVVFTSDADRFSCVKFNNVDTHDDIERRFVRCDMGW